MAHEDDLAAATRRRRSDRGQEIAVEEVVDRLDNRRLLLGESLRPNRSDHSHRCPEDSQDEDDEDQRRCDERSPVAAYHLAQPVPCTWRRRHDRLVVEMTPDVPCQIIGGLIAPVAILFHGFHHDPVEIAAEGFRKRRGIRVAVAGDR